jgi:flagellar biosynthesis protein
MRKDTRKKAAALAYDPAQDPAPRVTAQGKGKTAQRIIELACEHGVPVRQDPALADALVRAECGSCVSEELYPLVAEIMAFVFMLEKKEAALKKKL